MRPRSASAGELALGQLPAGAARVPGAPRGGGEAEALPAVEEGPGLDREHREERRRLERTASERSLHRQRGGSGGGGGGWGAGRRGQPPERAGAGSGNGGPATAGDALQDLRCVAAPLPWLAGLGREGGLRQKDCSIEATNSRHVLLICTSMLPLQPAALGVCAGPEAAPRCGGPAWLSAQCGGCGPARGGGSAGGGGHLGRGWPQLLRVWRPAERLS